MSEAPIKFGTSGWRAILAEGFTFEKTRLATSAIAVFLNQQGTNGPVIVGFDTRFLAERFALDCARVLSRCGINVLLCEEAAPTPTVAHAILSNNAAAGLNLTASHNPPEYQGIKFSTSDGAPALPEITQVIESEIVKLQRGELPDKAPESQQGTITRFDPRGPYLTDLGQKILFDRIANAGMRIAVDPLWGTARGYLDGALVEAGCEVKVLHNWRDPLFGGGAPEPSPDRLADLRQVIVNEGYDIGLATDGDADRFGILDRSGEFVTANELIALLCDYLYEFRGWRGAIARSVSTSRQVDRVAQRRGIEVIETPVGFKFIGELIKQDRLLLGGEESAGLSIKGHVPEKDGILACLLTAEMVAVTGVGLKELLDNLYRKDGKLWSGRIGIRLTEETRTRFLDRWSGGLPSEFAGRAVSQARQTEDGFQLTLDDGSWMLLRLSGTEPLVRCYAEANSPKELEVLLESGRKQVIG